MKCIQLTKVTITETDSWEVTFTNDDNITTILFAGHRAKYFAEEYIRYCGRNDG